MSNAKYGMENMSDLLLVVIRQLFRRQHVLKAIFEQRILLVEDREIISMRSLFEPDETRQTPRDALPVPKSLISPPIEWNIDCKL